MPKVLVVDDEQHIVELVKFNLCKEGWEVFSAFDGPSAMEMAGKIQPNIIVLDIMLPEIDGFEVCRQLRARLETAEIPIIMLSARTEDFDRIIGLELGADDYMTKPFSPRELIARIKARLRKKNICSDSFLLKKTEINSGAIVIKPERYEVFVNGVKQELTLKEFELLKLLVTNRGKVFTRNVLLERIWGYDYSHDTRTVDVHIRHLRQKIDNDPANYSSIETIRGIGYKFRG